MKVLHETEQPSSRVPAGLLEAFPGCASALLADSIAVDSLNAKLTLFWSEPSSLRRVIGQQEESKDCDKSGDGAFDNKEPVNPLVSNQV